MVTVFHYQSATIRSGPEDSFRQRNKFHQWQERASRAPHGSHVSGVWERCICTMWKILQALLQEQIHNNKSLTTFMCEVESIINSCPIKTVFSDLPDKQPLTPNHLVLLFSKPPIPPGLFHKEDLLSRRRWKQVQYLADIFWKRWLKEYLPLLQSRQKWLHPRRKKHPLEMLCSLL